MEKKMPPENHKKFSDHSLADAASPLLERPAPEEYIREWTRTLKEPSLPNEALTLLPLFIFRLGKEWLALPVMFVKEVTYQRPVHCIPHRSNKILQGIINLNGELQLSIALHELLQIETTLSSDSKHLDHQRHRIIAMVKEGEVWVFPVDEMDGIYNWNLLGMEEIPVNLSKSTHHFIKGIIKIEEKRIGLLDEELLFSSLKRSLQ